MNLKVALAQYHMPEHKNFSDWKEYVESWVCDAKTKGADFLVFPEYGSIELVSLLSKEIQKDLHKQLNEIQSFFPEFISHYQDLSNRYDVGIVAPSFPYKKEDQSFVNRAYYFCSGRYDFQEKQMMTRFENEEWKISSGQNEMKIFEFKNLKFGISICYDIEFPDFSRKLALSHVDFIVAPSCTERVAGMNRVHIGARARALENQLYVLVSQTVGDVHYSEAIDKNCGKAAIYSTPDLGLPEDGIIAIGSENSSTWLIETIEPHRTKRVRAQGAVFNFNDLSKILTR